MAEAHPSAPALMPESLLTAGLLAATAGLLDTATYLLHGRVFASAMTGNTVLLGISAASGNSGELLRHIVPIASFLAGVAAAKAACARLGPRASCLGLLLEVAALISAGLVHSNFPETLFTGGVSFVAAVQVVGFRRVGPYSYSSTFVTGDLRDFTEGLTDWLSPGPAGASRDTARAKARDLAVVWTAFLAGAALGAVLAPRFGNHVYWGPLPALLAILAGCARGQQSPDRERATHPRR